MKITALQFFLWYAAPLLQAVILFAMIWRKVAREFPAFFSYTVFHLIEYAATFAAYRHSYRAYFYTYWGTEIADSIITLVVIQEIFAKVFEPYQSLRKVETTAFRWGAVFLCLLALLGATLGPSPISDRLIAGLLIVQRSTALIQTGLLFLLFVFARLFGLGWRHYVFGISLGFGVSAALGLVIAAFRAQFGTMLEALSAPLLSASVLLGIGIWTYYFVSEKSVSEIGELPNAGQLQEWNEALAGILRERQRG
jgi:hypothetical protein